MFKKKKKDDGEIPTMNVIFQYIDRQVGLTLNKYKAVVEPGYAHGYSDGYLAGQTDTYEKFKEFITTGFAIAPQKIIVSTEEYERIRKQGFKEDKQDGES